MAICVISAAPLILLFPVLHHNFGGLLDHLQSRFIGSGLPTGFALAVAR
jgi:hypothetical protein